jgi:hypothetical protein
VRGSTECIKESLGGNLKRRLPFCKNYFIVNVKHNYNTRVNSSKHGVRFHPYARNIVSARNWSKHGKVVDQVARAGAMNL